MPEALRRIVVPSSSGLARHRGHGHHCRQDIRNCQPIRFTHTRVPVSTPSEFIQAEQFGTSGKTSITSTHNPATMSSGEVLKADKDFTKEVDAAIPEAEKLAAVCSELLILQPKLIRTL